MYWSLNQKEKGRQKDAEEFKEEDFSCESELRTNSGEVLHRMNLIDFNKSAQFTGGGKKKEKKRKKNTSQLPCQDKTRQRVSKWSQSPSGSCTAKEQALKSELADKSY